jgi:nucleoside 2-deoxyribosyltransferase-like protein
LSRGFRVMGFISMNYIEAPHEYEGEAYSIFLAGSISDPANWQGRFAKLLADNDVTIFNPRRKELPLGNRAKERRQIEWEHRHLARASLVVFWFTPPTVCPIALFELGACCESGIPLVVGVDPKYALNFDVGVHLSLRRPELKVLESIDGVARAIIEHATHPIGN